jgi:hypothetical protein
MIEEWNMKTRMLLVLISLLAVVPVFGMDDYNAYTYAVSYNTKKTIAWASTAVQPTGYEYYFSRLEDGKTLAVSTVAKATITVTFKTHGHWVINVRSFTTVNSVKKYGAWGNSLDPSVGVVRGNPQAWVIYVLQP